jgi:AcrR family transcriptional regulator
MARTKKRRTQAERSEESSRLMLDAATQLIADQGFLRTTIPEIARKAGYSHGLVTQRFGSKSELVRMLAEEFQTLMGAERFMAVLDEHHGLEGLIAMTETYIDTLASSGPLGRAYYELFAESIVLVPEIHETFVNADRLLRAFIKRVIRAAIEAGELPRDVSVRGLASTIVAILRGVSLQWLLDPTGIQLGEVKREVRRLFEIAGRRP